MKSRILVVFMTALLSLTAHSAEPSQALKAVPDKARESLVALFDWQKSLTGLPEEELFSKFGKPDEVAPAPANRITGKPIHTNIYRISMLSTLRISVDEGLVTNVALVLVPYPNEEWPGKKLGS